MKRRILRNAVRCLNCNETIESTTIYDFKTCSCGKVGVDGGRQYLKRIGSIEDYEELSRCMSTHEEWNEIFRKK
ncbi:DUF7695 domain-containing protein [Paenibacillus guangzhouensis]